MGQEPSEDVPSEASDCNFTGGDHCVGGEKTHKVFPRDWSCKRIQPNVVHGWKELRGPFFSSNHSRKDAAVVAILLAFCVAALDRAVGVSSFSHIKLVCTAVRGRAVRF